MYLSSLQCGLQSAHVVAEMFIKYPYVGSKHAEGLAFESPYFLHEWATDHKTMILLNGGYSESLHTLVEFFNTKDNPYPWAKFHEGQDALDGALTCVGIILPEKIYSNVEIVAEASTAYSTLSTAEVFHRLGLDSYDQFLCKEISKYGLAR